MPTTSAGRAGFTDVEGLPPFDVTAADAQRVALAQAPAQVGEGRVVGVAVLARAKSACGRLANGAGRPDGGAHHGQPRRGHAEVGGGLRRRG